MLQPNMVQPWGVYRRTQQFAQSQVGDGTSTRECGGLKSADTTTKYGTTLGSVSVGSTIHTISSTCWNFHTREHGLKSLHATTE